MYYARTFSIIIFILLATVSLRTVEANDCSTHDATASETHQRSVLQAQGQVMIVDAEDTPELYAFAHAVIQAQGQVMAPAVTVASVDMAVGLDNYQRATLEAEGQILVQASAQACLTGD